MGLWLSDICRLSQGAHFSFRRPGTGLKHFLLYQDSRKVGCRLSIIPTMRILLDIEYLSAPESCPLLARQVTRETRQKRKKKRLEVREISSQGELEWRSHKSMSGSSGSINNLLSVALVQIIVRIYWKWTLSVFSFLSVGFLRLRWSKELLILQQTMCISMGGNG